MTLRALFATAMILMMGCSPSEQESETDAQAHLDLNLDGRPDVQIEPSDNGHYEIVDRNFDGKADERFRYDVDGRWLSGQSDDDFDGRVETYIATRNGLHHYVIVDTDRDDLLDLTYAFAHGRVVYSERYYEDVGAASAEIATIKYDAFGYPSAEERISSSLTAREYHEKANALLENK